MSLDLAPGENSGTRTFETAKPKKPSPSAHSASLHFIPYPFRAHLLNALQDAFRDRHVDARGIAQVEFSSDFDLRVGIL